MTIRPSHRKIRNPNKSSAIQNNSSSIEQLKAEVVKDTGEKTDTHAKEKLQIDRQLSEYTGQLAIYTKKLSQYTFWLVIATVIIAVIGAWQGRQLKRTVDIMHATELPIIMPMEAHLRSGGRLVSQSEEPSTGAIRITFQNYGRTPAMITGACLQRIVIDRLPRVPQYEMTTPYPGGVVIDADRSPRNYEPENYRLGLTPEQVRTINANQSRLWIFGFITYEDFMGNPHECRFCFRWSVQFNDFVLESDTPPAYTQNT